LERLNRRATGAVGSAVQQKRAGVSGGGGPDSSDSGQDARTALRLIRRGANDEEIADWLREQASYLKRLAPGERIAEEYLRRTIAWARSQPVVNPWSGSRRVNVIDAEFERLPARPTGQAAADRVTLWLMADDGQAFARQQIYLHARDVYAAVLGDIPPAAWLETKDSGTALAQTLIGRELEIVIPPGAVRASRMRRVEGIACDRPCPHPRLEPRPGPRDAAAADDARGRAARPAPTHLQTGLTTKECDPRKETEPQ
jgi:hypothetical protein